jgi:hypothetical protein
MRQYMSDFSRISELQSLFTKERLAAWLATKPPEGEYSYFNQPRCGLTEFLHENGFPGYLAGGQNIYPTGAVTDPSIGSIMALPRYWNTIVLEEPLTYGAWLERVNARL